MQELHPDQPVIGGSASAGAGIGAPAPAPPLPADFVGAARAAAGLPAAAPGRWLVTVDGPTDGPAQWIDVRHDAVGVPAQGWKLHVSASMDSALAVLGRVLPVLVGEPVAFKVAASPARLADLNCGEAGATQVGKFVTVYPGDDAQAVRLAVALDQATDGLRGPRVPSDRPLRPGSLVHYRYGSFRERWLQTPSGEVVPALADPDGQLRPDRRGRLYAAPDWACDPFEGAGVVCRRPPVDLVVGGRYLTARVLASSPEVSVLLAVDLVGGRRCVVKQARRHAGAASAGAAVERLRHEAAVLDRLADPRAPAVYDRFEDDDTATVVVEHVEGLSVEQHVGGLRAEGRFLPDGRLRSWATDVAGVLGRMHDLGLVYGDLKPPHVIVDADDRVRLIDFESVWPAPPDLDSVVAGTAGYVSPQRLGGHPPTPADDVFALGALLYFMATGAEPSLAPDRTRLLDRPVALLNPAVDPPLADLIRRCLDPDPSGRPPSMARVAAELGGRHGGRRRPARHPDPVPVGEAEARAVADRLAAELCDQAVPIAGGGVAWPGVGSGPLLRDVSGGAAGTVLALARAAEVVGGERILETVGAAARWLAASSPFAGGPLPGLYVGEAGIAAALLRAGQVLGDGELVGEAAARSERIAAMPHASPDLYNGTAGRLRFHLALWDATGDGAALRAASAAAERLLSAARAPRPGHVEWTIPDGYGSASGRSYLGYAHGLAGIADALLDLHDAAGDDDVLAAVQAAARRLVALALPALDDGQGFDWPDVEGAGLVGPLWCHGAAGVARFLARCARHQIAPGAPVAARGALASAARGARSAGPGLCHGLAGNLDVLIDGAADLDDPTLAEQAGLLGRVLLAFTGPGDALEPSSPGRPGPADLMTGLPGVLAGLLRLAAPGRPHLLARAGLAGRPPARATIRG